MKRVVTHPSTPEARVAGRGGAIPGGMVDRPGTWHARALAWGLWLGSLCPLCACSGASPPRSDGPSDAGAVDDSARAPMHGLDARADVAVEAAPVRVDAGPVNADAGPSGVDAGAESGPEATPDAASDAAGNADGPSALDAGDAAPGDAVAPTDDFRFAVTTKPSPTMRFGTRNLLAIWVENEQGQAMRVLGHWAVARSSLLRVYTEHTSEIVDGFSFPPVPDDPDVISGATLSSHAEREVHWDLLDAQGNHVSDGTYVVWVENVQNNDGSITTQVPFTVGPDPVHLELEETVDFGPIVLDYEPLPRQ